MSRVERDIAVWVAESSGRGEADARACIKRSFIDTIACMVAGRSSAVVRAVAPAARGIGGCWAVDRSERVDAPVAGLINGTAAHALDYDDVCVPGRSHASAVLVPVVLAVGEWVRSSGEEILEAYRVGLSIMTALGRATDLVDYRGGWHTTLAHGVLAAAGATARLLHLDPPAIQHAIGIATSMSGGRKRQFGSMAKPLHAGLAARAGIEAARFAHGGVTAEAEALTGEGGLLDALTGVRPTDGWRSITASLAADDAHTVLWLKPYPCCASTHGPIDALLSAGVVGRVQSIEVMLNEVDFRNLPFHHPRDESEAKFSLPHCLAVAAQDGAVTLRSFDAESISRVAALREDVSVALDPAFDHAGEVIGQMRIHTIEGSTVSLTIAPGRGHPTRPMTDAEVTDKFAACVGLDAATSAPFLEAFVGIDARDSLDEVIDALIGLTSLRDRIDHPRHP